MKVDLECSTKLSENFRANSGESTQTEYMLPTQPSEQEEERGMSKLTEESAPGFEMF
jgi:hypothetical protein